MFQERINYFLNTNIEYHIWGTGASLTWPMLKNKENWVKFQCSSHSDLCSDSGISSNDSIRYEQDCRSHWRLLCLVLVWTRWNVLPGARILLPKVRNAHIESITNLHIAEKWFHSGHLAQVWPESVERQFMPFWPTPRSSTSPQPLQCFSCWSFHFSSSSPTSDFCSFPFQFRKRASKNRNLGWTWPGVAVQSGSKKCWVRSREVRILDQKS